MLNLERSEIYNLLREMNCLPFHRGEIRVSDSSKKSRLMEKHLNLFFLLISVLSFVFPKNAAAQEKVDIDFWTQA